MSPFYAILFIVPLFYGVCSEKHNNPANENPSISIPANVNNFSRHHPGKLSPRIRENQDIDENRIFHLTKPNQPDSENKSSNTEIDGLGMDPRSQKGINNSKMTMNDSYIHLIQNDESLHLKWALLDLSKSIKEPVMKLILKGYFLTKKMRNYKRFTKRHAPDFTNDSPLVQHRENVQAESKNSSLNGTALLFQLCQQFKKKDQHESEQLHGANEHAILNSLCFSVQFAKSGKDCSDLLSAYVCSKVYKYTTLNETGFEKGQTIVQISCAFLNQTFTNNINCEDTIQQLSQSVHNQEILKSNLLCNIAMIQCIHSLISRNSSIYRNKRDTRLRRFASTDDASRPDNRIANNGDYENLMASFKDFKSWPNYNKISLLSFLLADKTNDGFQRFNIPPTTVKTFTNKQRTGNWWNKYISYLSKSSGINNILSPSQNGVHKLSQVHTGSIGSKFDNFRLSMDKPSTKDEKMNDRVDSLANEVSISEKFNDYYNYIDDKEDDNNENDNDDVKNKRTESESAFDDTLYNNYLFSLPNRMNSEKTSDESSPSKQNSNFQSKSKPNHTASNHDKFNSTHFASDVMKDTLSQNKRTVLSENRHLQHSSSETCRHRLEAKLVVLPGCVPKSIITTSCQGTCHSRSFPEWDSSASQLRYVPHCTCCAPNSIKFKNIVFRCPRRRGGVLIKRMGFPFQCTCRPCNSAPQVDAEQPYDY